jgi:peptide-N4-(N-acetyl-beta-glucosaminyl)asparagine amidase
MDSCENAFDTPLIYEKGWGKKLTYVIGVSKEEMVDVTKRYVLNPKLNRMRRTQVPESWLATVL